MAKKKTQPPPQPNDQHPVQSMLHALVLLGVNPADLELGWEPDKHTHVSIAVPSMKFGICLDGDKAEKLEEDKWIIKHIRYSDVEAFSRVFQALDAVRIANSYIKADKALKTTSEPEEWLWAEMVDQNINPLPDRNHVFRREDGTELTTPDFTWEEYRIAFFMDGAYWHSVKDDKELLRDIAESKDLEKHIIDTRRDKVQKDGRIRSELASMGWRVLSCTDEDLKEEGGIRRVVGQIRTAIEQEAALKAELRQRLAEMQNK